MFKNTFEGKIVDAIKGGLSKELEHALPTDLNNLLAKDDGFVAIPGFSKLMLDFMASEAGAITDTSIQ
jgi:hypothetical protein